MRSPPRGCSVLLLALEPAAGRLQEHVVERRPGDARSRRRRICVALEPAHDLGDRAGTVLHVQGERRPARPPPARARAARPAPPRWPATSAPSTETDTTSWPISALSCSGVPSATICPSSMIASAVAQLVGLLEVLRGQEHGRAAGVDPAHLVPDRSAARPDPGRWSARRGTAPRASGRARWPDRGGASSRRSRSWCAARPRRSGRRARAAPRRGSRPR